MARWAQAVRVQRGPGERMTASGPAARYWAGEGPDDLTRGTAVAGIWGRQNILILFVWKNQWIFFSHVEGGGGTTFFLGSLYGLYCKFNHSNGCYKRCLPLKRDATAAKSLTLSRGGGAQNVSDW